jgi:hypothetical protein
MDMRITMRTVVVTSAKLRSSPAIITITATTTIATIIMTTTTVTAILTPIATATVTAMVMGTIMIMITAILTVNRKSWEPSTSSPHGLPILRMYGSGQYNFSRTEVWTLWSMLRKRGREDVGAVVATRFLKIFFCS